MRQRLRVILAGWAVFFAVFLPAVLLVPDPTALVPVAVAAAVTAEATPVLYARLRRRTRSGRAEA